MGLRLALKSGLVIYRHSKFFFFFFLFHAIFSILIRAAQSFSLTVHQ